MFPCSGSRTLSRTCRTAYCVINLSTFRCIHCHPLLLRCCDGRLNSPPSTFQPPAHLPPRRRTRRLSPEEAKEGRSDPPGAMLAKLAPVQFLARIAMWIPLPRFPLQHFAGVLAPKQLVAPAVVAMRPPPPIHNASVEPRPTARQRRPGTTRHRSANEPWRTTPVAMRRPHRLGLPHPQGIPPRRARLSLR